MKYKLWVLSLVSAVTFFSMYSEVIYASDINQNTAASTLNQLNSETQPETNLTEEEKKILSIVNNTPKNLNPVLKCDESTNFTDTENALISQRDFQFENGDYFWIKRYEFKSTNAEKSYTDNFTIPGNTIEVGYTDPLTKQWVTTTDISQPFPVTTLFLNTDSYNAVISVPAVYKNSFEAHTLQPYKELEKPLKITKSGNNYNISYEFPQNMDSIGEIWAIQSANPLFDWNSPTMYSILKSNDLAIERRWSWDGYYFTAPSNYVPSAPNMYYRHPANYSGSSWVKYGSCLFADDMGYITTKICAKNQNPEGFWATGPKSQWLEADFNIKENFYDTRFNTDFAENLISAYKKYNEPVFLESAVKYGEFFKKHAQNHHYETKNGGWLVEDYAGTGNYKRTHVSLNHQLSEMNFLYNLYMLTKEQSYYDLAELMLKAIDDTKDEWVLPNNNLNYALMYTGTANTMVDYPYLTYNDLFETKKILTQYFNRTNETINYLMESKKIWMDANNITEYKK